MVKRKVIQQANQAYTITLPIDWVRQNNISKDSEVDILISDKSLIIENRKGVEVKKSKIKIENLNPHLISRIIHGFYAKGIDEIEIESGDNITQSLYRAMEDTIGYALVKNERGSYTIKDISGSNYSELDDIFKRVFQMVLSFYESAIEDVFGEQKETRESLDSRDLEINKFCLFLERAVNKMSYPDPTISRVMFAYAFSLEKLGDEIHRLWRTNIKYNIKKTPKLRELIDLSNKGLIFSFDFYYQFNLKASEKIYETRDETRERSLHLLKLDPHTARFVRHAVKIVEDAADLSHLTLIKNL